MMRAQKRWIVTSIVGAATVGFLLGRFGSLGRDHDHPAPTAGEESTVPHGQDEATRDPVPTAQVQTTAIEQGGLPIDLPLVGMVTLAPAGTRVISAAGECRICRLLTAPGDHVEAGTILLELEASQDARAQLAEAMAMRTAAQRDLDQIKARSVLHLATVQELSQAQAALEIAEVKATASQQRLPVDDRLVATVPGTIARILVQEGQVVASGSVLVEQMLTGHLEAKLGIDPAMAHRIVVGQPVWVTSVRRAPSTPPLVLAVASLTTYLTPDTRLLDVLVPIPDQTGLMAGDYVSGRMTIEAAAGLIVPRSALVQEADTWVIFTVAGHLARRRPVTVLAENRERSTVAGDGLAAGMPVVVHGLTGLVDGMMIETTGPVP